MFRTSICFDSGGCVPISNSGPSFSPGSFRPSLQRAVGAGDAALDGERARSFDSTWVETGKILTPSRLIGTS